MSLSLLLLHSTYWLSVDAIKRINVISGRAVFCGNLSKQRTDDLERRASLLRNSFSEILDPPLDDEGKVRLRWLGDEETCAAVNRLYPRSVPLVYVHYIENNNGSETDLDLTIKFLAHLARKLRRDTSQILQRGLTSIHDKTENRHVLTRLSYADYHWASQQIENFPSRYSPEIVQRVLDRKLVPVSHRIHEDIMRLDEQLKNIAGDNSPKFWLKQFWFPLRRPALCIHLFPNERSFIRHGGALCDEIIGDPRHFTMMFANEAPQMIRWTSYWPVAKVLAASTGGLQRTMQSVNADLHLLVGYAHSLSDPQVLKDKRRLSSTIHTIIRLGYPERLQQVLETMKQSSEWKPVLFSKTFRKLLNLLQMMQDDSHRFRRCWREEQDQTLTLKEKAEALDVFEERWTEIVMAELGLRKGDRDGFWKLFGIAIRERWVSISSDNIDRLLAQDAVLVWKGMEHFFDPTFTLNIVLLKGPDIEQSLLKEVCLGYGYSWKTLKNSIKRIDYENEWEESSN